MADYSGEKWVTLYQQALVELEHARMRGRVGEARTEIVKQVERLKSIPGLHAEERLAIDDALGALRFLVREEDRYDENERRRALEIASQKLRVIAPKVESLGNSSEG